MVCGGRKKFEIDPLQRKPLRVQTLDIGAGAVCILAKDDLGKMRHRIARRRFEGDGRRGWPDGRCPMREVAMRQDEAWHDLDFDGPSDGTQRVAGLVPLCREIAERGPQRCFRCSIRRPMRRRMRRGLGARPAGGFSKPVSRLVADMGHGPLPPHH